MTTSEAATERSITFSIRIGYWNVGLQEAALDCDGREKHLGKLKDVAELWVKHSLHAVCLCEMGMHHIGYIKEHNRKVVEDTICAYIRELHRDWVTTKRMRDRAMEPALHTYWNYNYMMICDRHCLRVEGVPKAMYIRQDGYRHYTAVVLRRLSADGTQQSPRVLAVNAQAPNSPESRLTDSMRREMISRVLEDALERTEGRLILGGDLNTDHESIQRLFGDTHLHMVTSKSPVRNQGDCACVSGMLAVQRQSNVGRTFQGADSASEVHDAVVVDASFFPGEARAEQVEASSSGSAGQMWEYGQAESTSGMVAANRCPLAT